MIDKLMVEYYRLWSVGSGRRLALPTAASAALQATDGINLQGGAITLSGGGNISNAGGNLTLATDDDLRLNAPVQFGFKTA